MNLALNLKVGDFLAPGDRQGRPTRLPATEVLINTPMIRDLIRRGEVHDVKEAMDKSRSQDGMHTFDQSLYKLYKEGKVRTRGSPAQRRLAGRLGLEDPSLGRRRCGEHDPYGDLYGSGDHCMNTGSFRIRFRACFDCGSKFAEPKLGPRFCIRLVRRRMQSLGASGRFSGLATRQASIDWQASLTRRMVGNGAISSP